MLLLHDIPTSNFYVDPKVVDDMWGVMLKYDLDSARVRLYDKQSEVVSSNDDMKATWYECRDNRFLVILGNMTPDPQEGTIQIGALKKGLQNVKEEFSRTTVPVTNDTLKISLKPRSFAMIGF